MSSAENKHIICVPGQRLCLSDKSHVAGAGTYERNGYVYATLAGVVKVAEKDGTSFVSVHSFNNQTLVPAPGDIITAKVTTVSHRHCKCEITCIGDVELTRAYKGIIRKEDIRATEKDKIEVYKCFRPGDVILGRVISTAENELGVVSARGEAGVHLVPVSWTEMQCPQTYVKEPRKVARIIPDTIKAVPELHGTTYYI